MRVRHVGRVMDEVEYTRMLARRQAVHPDGFSARQPGAKMRWNRNEWSESMLLCVCCLAVLLIEARDL